MPYTSSMATPLKIPFEKGDRVRVTEGAFENCHGVVLGTDPRKKTVRIEIRILENPQRVELNFWQVKKV